MFTHIHLFRVIYGILMVEESPGRNRRYYYILRDGIGFVRLTKSSIFTNVHSAIYNELKGIYY